MNFFFFFFEMPGGRERKDDTDFVPNTDSLCDPQGSQSLAVSEHQFPPTIKWAKSPWLTLTASRDQRHYIRQLLGVPITS